MDLVLAGLVLPQVENHSLAVLRDAAGRAGYEARVLGYGGWPDLERTVRAVLALRPRVVGVSIQSTEAAAAVLGLVWFLRRRGYRGRIVCGGHFATLEAEALLRQRPELDAVIRFAGEQALVGLLGEPDEAAMAELPGLLFRAADGTIRRGAPPRTSHEQVLRAPARDGLCEHLGQPAADLVASWGCEHRCSYCCVAGASSLARTEARQAGRDASRAGHVTRSIDGIAEEMSRLWHEHGARVFNFMDDNLLPRSPRDAEAWARGLRAKLDHRGVGRIAASMQLRCDAVDAGSADALRALGLVRAYVGIDGYSDRQLRALGRRADADAGPRAVELLGQRGVFVVCNALLIGPSVPFDAIVAELDGLARIEGAPVHLLPIDVRAGTGYARRAERLGLVEGGLLWRHYRFADARSERVARVVTSLPTRLAERSVPVALYDLGYNLGIARQLVPEADVAHAERAYAEIAGRWNADQVRVLRRAVDAAATGSPDAADALARRESTRVRRHDDALLAECDGWLAEVERAVRRVSRGKARAHARGRLLAGVAFSMSLAACGARSEPVADAAADATPDAPADAAADAPSDVAVDAPSCPDGRTPGETPSSGSCGFCEDLVFELRFDAEGRVVDIAIAGDAGAMSDEIRACLQDMFADYCYPSLAGETYTLESHCWIA